MRLLGFIGILGLLMLAGFGLFVSVRAQDWKGVLLMLFLVALVAFFTAILWRGWQVERARDVKICGPDFSSGVYSIGATVAIAVMPFIIAFK